MLAREQCPDYTPRNENENKNKKYIRVSKVQILSEGYKIWKNLLPFVEIIYLVASKQSVIFFSNYNTG